MNDGVWEATVETRKRGATGAFTSLQFTVQAAGLEQAVSLVLNDVDRAGLEPGVILGLRFIGRWHEFRKQEETTV